MGSSLSVSNDKTVGIIRIDGRLLFGDFADACAPRPAFEGGAELGELLGRADGVGFDPAVRQIFCVAAQVQALRGVLSKIAEADTLHDSGDDVTPGLFVLTHKAVNCSRERNHTRGVRSA